MKTFVNILLGLLSGACAAALVLQGFVIPNLESGIDILLRIGMAAFLQILMLQLTDKKLLRYAPLLVSAVAAVWGFFLLLTSPSWVNATVEGWLHDYGIFFTACLLVCALQLSRPWLKGKFRQLRKVLRRRKKKKQTKNTMPRF